MHTHSQTHALAATYTHTPFFLLVYSQAPVLPHTARLRQSPLRWLVYLPAPLPPHTPPPQQVRVMFKIIMDALHSLTCSLTHTHTHAHTQLVCVNYLCGGQCICGRRRRQSYAHTTTTAGESYVLKIHGCAALTHSLMPSLTLTRRSHRFFCGRHRR